MILDFQRFVQIKELKINVHRFSPIGLKKENLQSLESRNQKNPQLQKRWFDKVLTKWKGCEEVQALLSLLIQN